MDAQRMASIKNTLQTLTGQVGKGVTKGFDPDFAGRVLDRLVSFADECLECEQELNGLVSRIMGLQEREHSLTRDDFQHLKKDVDKAVSHLQKRHKLVQEGQYMGTYISLGISLGLVFGLAVFDNIALGLPVGLALGVAIGSGKDGQAKKNGLVI